MTERRAHYHALETPHRDRTIEGTLTIDALHLAIALTPLAVYFLLLGFINLSRRPLLTTGARDTAALGIAISGLIAAGPMDLFLPEAATNRYGGYVWLLLFAFYALCLALIVLTLRPRLIIYNASPEQLRSILAEVVAKLDGKARWAGDSLVLPQLGVQLYVDMVRFLRNAQLVAAGPPQGYSGWKKLEEELTRVLRETRTRPKWYGWGFLVLGAIMLLLVIYRITIDPTAVLQAVNQMLRR